MTNSTKGKTFRHGEIISDDDAEQETGLKEKMRAGEFLEANSDDFQAPESICSDESMPASSNHREFRLDSVKIKGLKFLFVCFLLTLLLFAGFQIHETYVYAKAIHWVWAVLFSAFIFTLISASAYVLYQFFRSNDDVELLDELRERANEIAIRTDFGTADPLIDKFDLLYVGKPQNAMWRQCKDSLPDYSNDKEVVEHINSTFLKKLDAEAVLYVTDQSLKTSFAIAISPWVIVDMLLSLWRNVNMVNTVIQIYGVRPSFRNRFIAMRRVFAHIIASGSSEAAIDYSAGMLGGQLSAGMLGARLVQGIGAGVYSARIGLAATQEFRPISFKAKEEPSLKEIVNHIKKKVTNCYPDKE